jgi:hypothetical protein
MGFDEDGYKWKFKHIDYNRQDTVWLSYNKQWMKENFNSPQLGIIHKIYQEKIFTQTHDSNSDKPLIINGVKHVFAGLQMDPNPFFNQTYTAQVENFNNINSRMRGIILCYYDDDIYQAILNNEYHP